IPATDRRGTPLARPQNGAPQRHASQSKRKRRRRGRRWDNGGRAYAHGPAAAATGSAGNDLIGVAFLHRGGSRSGHANRKRLNAEGRYANEENRNAEKRNARI